MLKVAKGVESASHLRIGAVNYLNTKPLIYDLPSLAPESELALDYPSRLAARLEAGELDVALIPVIEYLRSGRYQLIPNIAIASRGPVLSVTLFSRKPWSEVSSIALDEGSRTSAALVQVLSRYRYGVSPRWQPLRMDDDPEAVQTDAVLLIGDRAMHACLPGFAQAYDLGEEWTRWTGLPFVFAVWAARHGVNVSGLTASLQQAKERGLANVGTIAAAEAERLGLGAGFCRRYLDTVLTYDLGPTEIAGLRRFAALSSELGLISPEIRVDEHGRASVGQGR